MSFEGLSILQPSPVSDSIYHVATKNTDSKAHGANMGPIWDRQDPGGPHVGPMNFVIWAPLAASVTTTRSPDRGYTTPWEFVN